MHNATGRVAVWRIGGHIDLKQEVALVDDVAVLEPDLGEASFRPAASALKALLSIGAAVLAI
jgi:hypothetical protein